MWVVKPCIKFLLGGFRHRVSQRLVGKLPQKQADETWECHPLGDRMRAAGLEEIGTYIYRKNNTVARYISVFPIMGVCMDA